MKYTEKKENGLTKMWNVIKSLAFSLVGMFSPFIQNERVCVFVRSFVCTGSHVNVLSVLCIRAVSMSMSMSVS